MMATWRLKHVVWNVCNITTSCNQDFNQRAGHILLQARREIFLSRSFREARKFQRTPSAYSKRPRYVCILRNSLRQTSSWRPEILSKSENELSVLIGIWNRPDITGVFMSLSKPNCINSIQDHSTEVIHSVFCLTTGPKPPPKRCLHIGRCRDSSFKWEYPLLSLRSSSSFLCLLPRLLATSISPFIFPSITCFRRRFLRKIQLKYRYQKKQGNMNVWEVLPTLAPMSILSWNCIIKSISIWQCRSQWPRGLMRRSAAARLLRLWVRIPPGVWIFVCCEFSVCQERSLRRADRSSRGLLPTVVRPMSVIYEGWNFNSGNYLFTTDAK